MANDLSAFQSERWSNLLVKRLDPINVMLPLINKDWEGDLRQNKTVWVRTPGNITMAPYSRGTPISYEDLTPTREAFTVNDGQYFAFDIDDLDKVQTDINTMEVYMRRAVVTMSQVIEAKLTAAYVNTPAANQITGASAAAITLDNSTSTTTGIYPLFVKARAIQSKNNVPNTTGARWAVVDPDTTSLLLTDTAHFIRAGDLGDKVVQSGMIGGVEVQRTAANAPGFIGEIAGYNVYESNNIAKSDAGAVKYILFGDNDAISYASQITEIEVLRRQDTFANSVRGLMLHDTFVPAESAKRLVYIKAVA